MISTQFVEEFEAAANKESYVSKHITKKYIPFESKISISKEIIKRSMYSKVGEDIVFIPDTPTRYMLFVMSIIQSYTDIELVDEANTEISSGQQKLDSFNLLEKSGATESIMTCIGTDIHKFNTVLKMVLDDTVDMERSLVPFLDTKAKAMQIGLEALNQSLERIKVETND